MELLLHGYYYYYYCNWRLSALYRSAVVPLTRPDINHHLLAAAMDVAAAMGAAAAV